MAKKLDIVLRSDYAPEVCASRLAEQIDFPQRAIFSFSGYKGGKPILGRISGLEFLLHKRRYWRNDFAPVLYGRMTNEGNGTRIEAYWGRQGGVRFFMRVWLGLAILIGVPAFFSVLKCTLNPKCIDRENLWIGLVVPPMLILWGFLLPRLGAALGLHERKHIVAFVEQGLVAGRTPIENPERNWKSSLDRFFI
jgi:hypothetical protein